MTITPAKLADARARLKRGTSMDAAADAIGVSPDDLRAALAPKLLPVRVASPPTVAAVVVAGPLRIEGLTIEEIARLVALCSG
jgi:hypothetical protein